MSYEEDQQELNDSALEIMRLTELLGEAQDLFEALWEECVPIPDKDSVYVTKARMHDVREFIVKIEKEWKENEV